jgi:hypothetical protein
MTCLAKTRPEGNETTPPAILVPPTSNPMAQLCVFELGSNIIRFFLDILSHFDPLRPPLR